MFLSQINMLWFWLLMYVYAVCIKSLIMYGELASAPIKAAVIVSGITFLLSRHLFRVIHKCLFCVVVYFKQVFNICFNISYVHMVIVHGA